jgi:hypothetical protein
MNLKKFASLIMVGAMAVGSVATAFATNPAAEGTKVEYVGLGQEAYTVTVPALLAPAGNGDVTVVGTWASNRHLSVTAPQTVTLINDISGADEKVLDITFAGIEKDGDNNIERTYSENLAVADIEDALFGTWSGKIVYTVGMEDVQ